MGPMITINCVEQRGSSRPICVHLNEPILAIMSQAASIFDLEPSQTIKLLRGTDEMGVMWKLVKDCDLGPGAIVTIATSSDGCSVATAGEEYHRWKTRDVQSRDIHAHEEQLLRLSKYLRQLLKVLAKLRYECVQK